MFEGRFTGRSAVITGGASGAGRATARRLVQEGGRVCLWDVNAEALETARAQIGATHAVMVDVSDPDAVATAARQSHAALGGIDLLLCSAAITGVSAPVMDFPVDNWQRVININLNGVFYCCKAITPYMIERGYGRIVNLASIAGKEGNPNLSAYSAAKAGVIGLTKSLGKELRGMQLLDRCGFRPLRRPGDLLTERHRPAGVQPERPEVARRAGEGQDLVA
jgi:2-dehydro-3-deoxy-L-rhamnonate dehydrogenase (NAD+)